MTINLSKGQKISLEKEEPGLKKVVVGLGWDVKKTDTGSDFDLDASCLLLGQNGKLVSERHLVFYNNSKSPDGAVEYTGDNRTGVGEGDDEQIKVDLTKVSPEITRILFVVTIYDAENRKQNFGQVSNAYVRLFNEETGKEIARYDLSEDYSTETAMLMAELYKHNNEWKMSALGNGYSGGLQAILNNYQ
ncbi:MAG: chemical-damaging agent resistance protein C [Candidatus Sericytochromatia bacterium]|nr:MAG: chemical-damaging agent resistance protein C [Candidatus Sericytochromatia bacterium]